MATQFTEITVADLQRLQALPTYKKAWFAMDKLRKQLGRVTVLVLHLAEHWGCSIEDITRHLL